MCVSKQQPKFDEPERGFTLIEVLISIVITMIVMASVFALLTQGQRAFQREPEIADLQQSARTVLDMVARDVLQAGSGLPPEFPAFSRINGAGDAAPTDVIEMIGTFQLAGELYLDPEDVTGFIGDQAQMRANTTNFEPANGGNPGDMVIVYNDTTTDPAITPTTPQWALARVTAVVEDPLDPDFQAQITLNYGEFDPQYSNYLDGAGSNITNANFLSTDGRFSKMTRVSVVRYSTVLDNPADYNGPPPQVLMRDVDFANNPQAVGYLENFQIAYTIGVTAPVDQDNPPDPAVDLAGVPMTAENMLAGVRISVTARSVTAGMQGASEGAAGREDDFIRKSFSTNVNPRNISAGINVRVMSAVQ
ncbi:MAG: hypothetical protein BMS9Abin37_0149 [Acidobacteriota bacterium]|nr:MAG: hypothetical protein BMS9Abin37_0149 [Acidobacteriota bacterium]